MDGTPGGTSGDEDRTTLDAYDAAGNITEQTAVVPGGTNQVTTYVYGDGSSPVPTNRLLEKIIYPDGDAMSDNVAMTYHATGALATRTDQRGVVIAYTYDDAGRLTEQDVTTAPAPANVGGDRRITYTYADLGQPETVTTYDASSAVSSEVLHDYDGFGQLVEQHQAHGGTVLVGTTPSVAYARDVNNGNRLASLTYPNGRTLTYDYSGGGGAGDGLSRPSGIEDGAQSLVEYSYLGVGRAVEVLYPQPQAKLTQTLDRFGQVTNHKWQKVGGATLDEFVYGYDRARNRTSRENTLATLHDELYSYDGLHRLIEMQRGTATGGAMGTLAFAQDWGLDALGNWASFAEDDDGDGVDDLSQTRTHNAANEITGIASGVGGAWVQPQHDAAGNMTRMPKPEAPADGFDATYDPWNRLVKLIDTSTSQTVAEYAYDGLGRRIVRKVYASGILSETHHAYWSAQWQLLEERTGGTSSSDVAEQYVWGLRYVDDLVLRDRDTTPGGDGSLDQRHYALQDGHFNVTAIVTTTGTSIERYRYTPYGLRTVLDPNFMVDADGESDVAWRVGHQGLMHDEATGLVYNRERLRHARAGRFVQRDPLNRNRPRGGYQDGMGLYAAYHVLHGTMDPLGLEKLVLKYYVESMGSMRWRDRMWEGFPTYANSVEEWVEHAKSQCGEDDCIDMIIIVGHSGIAGMAGLGGQDVMMNGDFGDRQFKSGVSAIEDKIRELRPYMCEDGTIEVRQCSSAQGDVGDKLLQNLGNAAGCRVTSYSEYIRFGFSGWSNSKTWDDGVITGDDSPGYDDSKKKKR